MSETVEKKPHGAPLENKNAQTHGVSGLKTKVRRRGPAILDHAAKRRRTTWINDVIREKGGKENLTAMQLVELSLLGDELIIVEAATREVQALPRLSNSRRRVFYALVKEWQDLRSAFSNRLHRFGLERVEGPKPSLADYLAARESSQLAIEFQDQPGTDGSDIVSSLECPAGAGQRRKDR